MIPDNVAHLELDIAKATLEYVKTLLKEPYESYVGHEDTARILSDLLGTEITYNRSSLTFEEGDILIIAQYVGPRLPEGTTKLPEGAEFKFYVIRYLTVY